MKRKNQPSQTKPKSAKPRSDRDALIAELLDARRLTATAGGGERPIDLRCIEG